ncbi:unnamed protein product, partial [Dicrocoelium dendriticum]
MESLRYCVVRLSDSNKFITISSTWLREGDSYAQIPNLPCCKYYPAVETHMAPSCDDTLAPVSVVVRTTNFKHARETEDICNFLQSRCFRPPINE